MLFHYLQKHMIHVLSILSIGSLLYKIYIMLTNLNTQPSLALVVLLCLFFYQISSACDSTCLTCSLDNSANNCTSCDGANNFRTLSSNPGTCLCNVGYIDDVGTAVCKISSCSYTCPSLCQGLSTYCTSCNSGAFRSLLLNKTCPCNAGYYDVANTQTCSACSPTCKTCTGTSTYCTDCKSQQFRTLSSNACDCKTGYYDSGVNICSACSYKCKTCTTSATNCVACADLSLRVSTPTCSCPDKYYDDGSTPTCLACHYSCKTCSNINSCDVCDSVKFRSLSSSTNKCQCLTRYYDPGVQTCTACYTTCLTCSGTLVNNCLSCNAAAYRIFNPTSSQCDCNIGYYGVTSPSVQQTCQACHTTCYTCSGNLNNQCSSCNSALYRTLSGNACNCIDGYYNYNNISCLACHSSCATCTDGSACVTCPSNKAVSTVTGYCECATTKYWDSSLSTCNDCNVACTTCSVTGTNCTTCSSTNKRYLFGNSCLCMTGYYQNNVALCATCSFKCLTCDVNGCITCSSTYQRTKSGVSCICSQGYYDDNTNVQCKSCPTTCQSCTSSTNCQSCDGSIKFRVLSGTSCICLDGYFDPGTGSPICQQCSNSCATCATTNTACATCAGTTRNSAPTCTCINRYYDDGFHADCLACHYSCLTCSNGDSCLTCDITKSRIVSLSSDLCVCNLRYYDDLTNEQCLGCDPTCLTCSGSTAILCLTCNSLASRIYNQNTKACDCLPKFYQTSTTVQLCSACHPTCLKCTGSTDTSCAQCSSSQQRSLSGNKCNCVDTFYLSSSYDCLACHVSCATCTNSSQCLTCPSNKIVNAVTGVCQCSAVTAWDSSGNVCASCHYSCKTCSILSTNCTMCETTNFRYLTGNTCKCNDGYYDNLAALCQTCSVRCMTCSASATSCLTCNSNNHRTLSGSTCPCNSGFYDDSSNGMCLACDYSCLTCIDSTACSTCNPLIKRIADPTSASPFCICETKFYQDLSTLTCKPCLYHCVTCSVSNRCLTCDSAKFRYLSASTTLCQCLDGYYDDGVDQLCIACKYDCKTCQDLSTCSTCDLATNHRVLSSATNRCVCTTRYFQSATPNTVLCQSCHYSCLTCSSSTSTSCLSCNSVSKRIQNATTCKCAIGYYDDSTNQLCLPCHYSCLTCSASGSCGTCDTIGTLRTLSGTCICPAQNYYDDGSTKYCKKCQYSCSTCASTASCTTCSNAKYRVADTLTPYCKCMDMYYDDTYSNQQCLPCPYQCTTCSNASACLTCDTVTNFRYLPALKCKCLDKYYNNGVNPICSQCSYSCQTCIVGDQCLTCNSNKFRTYDYTTFLCSCMIGYFDTGTSNQVCSPCSYTCKKCLGSASVCTDCDSTKHRTLDSGASTCPCNQYYYDDLINVMCLSCHYSCLTCSDSVSCDTCDPVKFREPDSTTDLCKCSQRYYDDGNNNQMCAPCQSSCLQCVGLSACTSCDTSTLRLKNATANYNGVISPYCTCNYKFYSQSNAQLICLACHYTCAVCTDGTSTSCLFCTADAHRTLNSTTKTCPCNNGYFDNNTLTETCLSCHPWCLICTNSTTTACTQCAATYFLKLDVTSCFSLCPNYFYGKTSTMTCEACSSHCIVCTNSSNCSSCDSGFPLYNYACLSSCPAISTYLDSGNNRCVDCKAGCKTCTSLISCQSCTTDYYYDAALSLCFPCNQYCKGCTGPLQSQCIDCQYPLLLNGTKCINITCPSGQFVNSTVGCVNCSTKFSNSITCNSSSALLCQNLYQLQNGACVSCANVAGYIIKSNACQQVCGDGTLIDLQCDDGNNLEGDGCSSICTIEQGWNCNLDANKKSVCTLDGGIQMKLIKTFKNGGANSVKLSLLLTVSIRLNSRFFRLTFQNLTNPNAITWQFSQNSTNLKNIQFQIYYAQSIEGKSMQLSYDTTRRRVLQSITLNFATTFTFTSYPPASYYSDQQINSNNTLKSIVFVGCIVLLCLCGLNFIFPRKMYMHIFIAACLPAQLFIFYGLVLQNYTDWIKWCLSGLYQMAFIGGFEVGQYTSLSTTEYFSYPIQITRNTGVASIIMLILWIVYGLAIIGKKFCCAMNHQFMKIIMYYRYIILTLQLCLLPHMAYSAVNALYNASLTSKTSALNVCLAIVINVYLLGLIVILFMLTDRIQPNQLMLQSDQLVKQEQKMNQNQNYSSKTQSLNYITSMPKRITKMDQTNQQFFIDLEQTSNQQQKMSKQSLGSARPIMSNDKVINIFDSDNKFEANNLSNTKQYYYDGVGYWYNNQQVYRRIQEKYINNWLVYDYIQLYATGGYKPNMPTKINKQQLLEPQQNKGQKNKDIILRKYSITKYYLPITVTKIYLTSLIASVIQSSTYGVFITLLILNLLYFFYILLVRPFRLYFSVIRILLLQLCFIIMNGLMISYSFKINNKQYSQQTQKSMLAVMATTVLMSILLLCMETVGAWRMEIWNKLQPCLVSMRLRGARKVMQYRRTKPKHKQRSNTPLQPIIKQEEQKQQAMDAFFARMLKKQSIQKQYKKQRLLKNKVPDHK